MNDSPTWYASSPSAVTAATLAEPPRRRFALAAGSALLVVGLGLAIAGTVDADSGGTGATDRASVSSTGGAAATGRGCDKSNDRPGGSGGTDGQTPSADPSPATDPSTSPDPANA